MIEKTIIKQAIKKIKLEAYLKKELDRAGFTGMRMSKTPMVTRIILNVSKPGLAIGKKGKTIRNLTVEIEKNFGIKNPQIEIQEIQNPTLDAKSQVDKIKNFLERGYSWRSVAYRTVEEVMGAGAQGVELVFKGKLSGKGGRKKKERIAKGYMKKAGSMSELIDYAKADSYPKPGAIGIKLRIVKPDTVFPDKLKIKEFLAKRAADKIAKNKDESTEKPKEDREKNKEKLKINEKKEDKKETKKDSKKKDNKEDKKKVVKKDDKKTVKKENKPAKTEKKKTDKKETKEKKTDQKEKKEVKKKGEKK